MPRLKYFNNTTQEWEYVVVGGQGPQGDTGPGVPAGGTAGQILSKIDETDYNTQWINEAPAASYTSTIKHAVKLGESIAKGQAVYVSSANGTNMIVSKASNGGESTSSKTMGLLETGGSTNATANVITEGLLAGLNTSSATAGDPVWLGTSGNLIYGLTNKPSAPAHLVFIGIVTRAHATQGEIFVRPQNGFELDELHDVSITSPAAGELVVRNSANTLWENMTLAEAGVSAVGHTHDDRYYTETETDNLLNAKASLSGATFTGDVSTNKLSVSASSGDEGGEIFLNKAATNTSLNGGVTIDVYQNRLRLFEQGGNARGYYLDMAAGANGVSTRISTNQFVASSASARDAYWGAGSLDLQNLGAQTIRTDKGWTEQYFHTFNSSTNPGGTTPAGWYPVSGNLPKGRKVRNGTGYNFTLGAWHSFPNSTYWQDEFTPWEVTFDTGRWIPNIAGIYNCSLGNFNNGIIFTIQTLKKNSTSADGTGQIASVTPYGNSGWNAGSIDRNIKLLTSDYIFWAFYAGSSTSSGQGWNTADSGNSYFGIEYVSPPFGA